MSRSRLSHFDHLVGKTLLRIDTDVFDNQYGDVTELILVFDDGTEEHIIWSEPDEGLPYD